MNSILLVKFPYMTQKMQIQEMQIFQREPGMSFMTVINVSNYICSGPNLFTINCIGQQASFVRVSR